LLQFMNAESPMELTESGIATELKLLQPENAEGPIDITEGGIVTEDKAVQSENALPIINSVVSLIS